MGNEKFHRLVSNVGIKTGNEILRHWADEMFLELLGFRKVINMQE